jgi:hypothetical protein
MHPGYMWYRKQRQACGASAYASAWCAPPTTPAPPEWHFSGRSRGGDAVFGSGSFGMRRPVRFLAERLELDEKQLSKLARIVEQIRIEREQAAVDLRRAAGGLADALEAGEFEAEAAEAAGQRRIDAATSVQKVVSRSLRELHALLDEEQREELASLVRTGAVKL